MVQTASIPWDVGAGAPRAAAGHAEEMICELVETLSAQLRSDPPLGLIYQRAAGERWTALRVETRGFWSAVMLGARRFSDAAPRTRLGAGELRASHFGRWLYRFGRTTRQVCPPNAAELFVGRAQAIVESLERAMAKAQSPRQAFAGRTHAADAEEAGR